MRAILSVGFTVKWTNVSQILQIQYNETSFLRFSKFSNEIAMVVFRGLRLVHNATRGLTKLPATVIGSCAPQTCRRTADATCLYNHTSINHNV